KLAIAWVLQQTAAVASELSCKLARIGCANDPPPRIVAKHEGRKGDRGQQRLARARRHIDKEPPNAPLRHLGELVAHCEKGVAGDQVMPRIAHVERLHGAQREMLADSIAQYAIGGHDRPPSPFDCEPSRKAAIRAMVSMSRSSSCNVSPVCGCTRWPSLLSN